MQTRIILISGMLLASVIFSGCTSGDTDQIQNEQETADNNITEFAMEENESSAKPNINRTMGKYTGSQIDFFWTVGDKLWLKNGTALVQSSKDNIKATAASARFYFTGTYSAENYPVRYTGNGTGDNITINNIQTQATPNDGTHIGADGDCGTAVATRSGGRYKFKLEHKASYLTFAPYYSPGFDESVKITQIKVTADQNVAGKYVFDDSGIKTETVTSPSKSITLTLTNGFAIPTAYDYMQNAAIMVIAPGNYTNFTVEFTLNDNKTGVTGTVSKKYPSITLNAGKNRRVSFDLAITGYESKYYMWDAKEHYWKGFENLQPYVNNTSNSNYPTDGTDRYYNKELNNTAGTHSATNAPNVNEVCWYIWKGDPHWDGNILWSMMKHLYKGGMWFKKKAQIPGFISDNYKGTDYRYNHFTIWAEGNGTWKIRPTNGRPANTDNYFFLPAMGYYTDNGTLRLDDSEYYGAYWTSTSLKNTNYALSLHFSDAYVGVERDLRHWGYPIQPTWFK